MLFFWLAILLFFVAPIMLGGVFGGRRYGRGRGRGPVVIWGPGIGGGWGGGSSGGGWGGGGFSGGGRSEEHTSELQSLMSISYAVFCLKKKTHRDKSEIRVLTHHITT